MPRMCCSSMTPASLRRTPPISKSLKCDTATRRTRRAGEAGALSGEPVTATLQKLRKCIAEKERVFALAQIGQRIESGQFGVDDSGVAHDHAAVRHPSRKSGKSFA